MANPSSTRRGQAIATTTPIQYTSRRRKLTLSKILLIFIFIAISICVISIKTFLNSNSIVGQPALDPLSPISPSNQQIAIFDSNGPITIAHAVSLIKCSKSSSVTGFLDAAAILRHSIHKNSIHAKNGANKSRCEFIH